MTEVYLLTKSLKLVLPIYLQRQECSKNELLMVTSFFKSVSCSQIALLLCAYVALKATSWLMFVDEN